MAEILLVSGRYRVIALPSPETTVSLSRGFESALSRTAIASEAVSGGWGISHSNRISPGPPWLMWSTIEGASRVHLDHADRFVRVLGIGPSQRLGVPSARRSVAANGD